MRLVCETLLSGARSQRGASVGASVGAEALKQSGAAHSSPPAPSLPVLLVLLVLLRFRVPEVRGAKPAGSQRVGASAEALKQSGAAHSSPPAPVSLPVLLRPPDHGSRDRPVRSSPVS
ncbi:hypothetical protein NDU88_007464 [Pleurodeles waltl]|uniref:Uncharacterized protein n=1 Tax=Pleurodeles waltl TaxID=8319 RepID=A0AAV7U176_PLEWA|nr:hypothetical protein NDU88_007464 [Pleurodeles waltl]